MSLSRTGHLFIPRRWRRTQVLLWLKRVHAWTGLWGSALFLLLGTSGFLLNHRNLLKIDTSAPVEVSSVEVAAPPTLADADALGRWAKTQLSMPVEGKPPPPSDTAPKAVRGRPVAEAERWTRIFTLPDAKVTVAYTPGSTSASVKSETVGTLAFVKNLHKGTGLGIAWILLIDTIAGALIAMSITGFLLWSNLHGPRLLAGALAGGALIWAVAAVSPFTSP